MKMIRKKKFKERQATYSQTMWIFVITLTSPRLAHHLLALESYSWEKKKVISFL